MSSLDNDTKVPRSELLSASCQAKTVAISEVLMVAFLPILSRRLKVPGHKRVPPR
jgi:hypothetical protein